MIDPIVHAALVTVAAWLIQLAFSYLGLDLGNEIVTGLAQFVVAYILSLFGLGLWYRATPKFGAMEERGYKPPFVR